MLSAARLLAAALVTATLVGLGGTAEQQQQPLRVLFLGNSLTAWNDLPEMVAAFGRARKTPIEVEAVTPGGYNLDDHWYNGSLERLRAGQWDAVVLQQGPSALPESQRELKASAQRWADEIRANGAKAALYGVWPENYRRSALPASIASYRNAAAAAGATLLPAGDAWRIAWRRNAKLKLYGPDRFHPSAMGTYLAALTVYAGLTTSSPVGLPRTLATTNAKVALAARTARTLQLSAAEALRGR